MVILGIDVGGSAIKGALVDVDEGRLITDRFRLETPESLPPFELADYFKSIVDQFSWSGPVGCGFPSVVRHGIAHSAANISEEWVGLNVDAIFGERCGCAVYTLNDADAAGMAEMRFGAGREYQKGVVLMITLGTGIGSAIFNNGVLLPNTEFGHLELKGKDAERRASDAARKRKDLSWRKWAERLEEYFSMLEALLSPDLIIVGGGISKEYEKFLPMVKTEARLIPAQLLNQAGIIGAALYADEKSK